jgi:dTDP-4-dehydrorhamnose reductase
MRQMAARAAAERRSLAESALEYSGVYHACNAGETTWFGFAEAALAMLHAARPGQELALLLPITTAEYPTAALRPRNSRLDCGRLARQFGLRLPDWRGSLAQVMELVLKERS